MRTEQDEAEVDGSSWQRHAGWYNCTKLQMSAVDDETTKVG